MRSFSFSNISDAFEKCACACRDWTKSSTGSVARAVMAYKIRIRNMLIMNICSVTHRNLRLYSCNPSNLMNDILLNQGRVHAEHSKPLVSTKHIPRLQDHFNTSFGPKSHKFFMLPKLLQAEQSRHGQNYLNNPGLLAHFQTPMGRIPSSPRNHQFVSCKR